ncbi:MAG: hypothetical protein WCI65_01500 [Synechococcaceae cyanobacterium ELA263]
MPQPLPGSAPSLPARPDPEAEFLKALGRRDAPICLRLLQQLVHRRGVGALDQLRRRSLVLEPEQRGWIWLDQLLLAEPFAAAAFQSPQEQASSDSNRLAEEVSSFASGTAELTARAGAVGPAVTMDPVATGSAGAVASAAAFAESDQGGEIVTSAQPQGLEPETLPQQLVVSHELDLRAEAAVDAAFAALAAEFPGYRQPTELAEQPFADHPEPPVELIGDPSLDPAAEQQPQRPFSFVIPRPLDQALLVDESPSHLLDSSDRSQDGQELAAESEGAGGVSGQAAGFWGRAEGRIAGLGDRLRSRFSLSRVKTMVRDCVEEAVSSLQGPNPVAGSQPQASLEQAGPATSSAETTGASATLAAASGAESLAAPWSLAQPDDGLASESVAPLPLHQAPVAAFGPSFAGDTWSPNPTAAEPQARLSTTQQLRQRLLGRRQGETRPAPAPQALSDLRAWLAADDDLPRAS